LEELEDFQYAEIGNFNTDGNSFHSTLNFSMG